MKFLPLLVLCVSLATKSFAKSIDKEPGLQKIAAPAADCSLPSCFPPNSGIPGGLPASETPQLVYFSFDDAVTVSNIGFYNDLFNNPNKPRLNPNGCPIRATYFNSHNYTDYSLVQSLYNIGHEFSSHSVTHREPSTWWETATVADYTTEIVGQRDNLHTYAAIPTDKVRGMRVPFLELGGDNQYTMLEQNNFTFDSSMSSRSNPPSWPFTLHDPASITTDLCSPADWNCPTKGYNLWEFPLNRWIMDGSYYCEAAMVDGCRPADYNEARLYLRSNFDRHYNISTKPAFGINMHASWFQYSADYFTAMCDFVDEILQLKDVYIVTISQAIEWMKNPTPVSNLTSFEPFSC